MLHKYMNDNDELCQVAGNFVKTHRPQTPPMDVIYMQVLHI